MRPLSSLLLVSLLATAAEADTRAVIATAVDPAVTYPLKKTDALVEVNGDPRERFTLHEIRRVNPGALHKGSILLLPSLLCSFEEYLADESGDVMGSLAAALALANFDVYGYSPRTTQIPKDGCTLGAFDCSVVGDWGLATYLDDVSWIRDRIPERPVVGGLSLGAVLGIGAVNSRPNDYAGLLQWEGVLYSPDAAFQTFNAINCAASDAQLAAGLTYNEGFSDLLKALVEIGEAAAVQVFGSPLPVFGTPTFTSAAPNALHTEFLYASFLRLRAFVRGFNYVESTRVLRDVQCSLAGDRTFTNNLAAYSGPILAIGAGRAYGARILDTASATSSTDVRYFLDADFGHNDAILSSNHDAFVENRIVDWLNHVF